VGAERRPTSQARLVPWHILTLGFWNIPFGLGRQIQACRAQSPSESIRVKSLPNKVGANKREWVAVNRCILEGIRIEVEGPSDLPRMQDWLSRHRGQTLELDRARQLEFGVPISAARAVLVAVTLQDGDPTTTQLGGVVRAIANRSLAEPVRLVFEGRSPAHLQPEDAETAASELLDTISRLVVEDEPVAEVA